MIIIIVSVLAAIAFATTLAVALGRAAAHADEELDCMPRSRDGEVQGAARELHGMGAGPVDDRA
jgi:hypothetical protein